MIVTINRREDLLVHLASWISGDVNHLFITGLPGTGKTRALSDLTKDHPSVVGWMTTHSTPLGFYQNLYKMQREGKLLVVIDDIDDLLHSRTITSMLKQVCDDKDERTIEWVSSKSPGNIEIKDLYTEEVPHSFTMNLRVCILTNNLDVPNIHAEAVRDRCFALLYTPERKTMIATAEKEGIVSREVSAYLLKRIEEVNACDRINYRTLKHLEYLRSKGFDWRKEYKKIIIGGK